MDTTKQITVSIEIKSDNTITGPTGPIGITGPIGPTELSNYGNSSSTPSFTIYKINDDSVTRQDGPPLKENTKKEIKTKTLGIGTRTLELDD